MRDNISDCWTECSTFPLSSKLHHHLLHDSPESGYPCPQWKWTLLHLCFSKTGAFLSYTIFTSLCCFAFTQWSVFQGQDSYLILYVSVSSSGILPLICNQCVSLKMRSNDSGTLGLVTMQLSGGAGRRDLRTGVKALFCCETEALECNASSLL